MDVDAERLTYAAVQVLVAGLAWMYARRHPEHRVVVALFTWQLLANVVRLAIAPGLDAAAPPYRGALLGAYYLDHALVLSFRFAMLAAFWVHFAGGRARIVSHLFGAAVLGVIAYKESTGASLEPVHRGIAWVVSGACVVVTARAMLAPADRLRVPDGVHAVLMLLVTTHVANAGLTLLRPWSESWSEIRVNDTLVDALLVAGYSIALAKEAIDSWRATSQS